MPMMLVEENEFEASYFKSAKGERFDELIRVFGKSTRAVCYSNTIPCPSPRPPIAISSLWLGVYSLGKPSI